MQRCSRKIIGLRNKARHLLIEERYESRRFTITIDQIGPHLAAMKFDGSFHPRFPVLHNTSVPDMATYRKWIAAGRPTMAQWLQNLAAYYKSLGWNSMPHAFVLPDGTIGLGAPFNVRGTHTPSWNSVSIGVETLGEFERDIWAGTPTEKATIALFGELCKRLGWHPDQYVRGVRGIHFHKEDPNTTHKTCPGKHVEKAKFVQQVLAYMGDSVAAAEIDRNGHLDVPVHAQKAPPSGTPTVARRAYGRCASDCGACACSRGCSCAGQASSSGPCVSASSSCSACAASRSCGACAETAGRSSSRARASAGPCGSA